MDAKNVQNRFTRLAGMVYWRARLVRHPKGASNESPGGRGEQGSLCLYGLSLDPRVSEVWMRLFPVSGPVFAASLGIEEQRQVGLDCTPAGGRGDGEARLHFRVYPKE